MKIYYKVFLKHRLYSASQRCTVDYELNEWISPTLSDSRLFVFDSLNAVLNYISDSSLWDIYECHCKGVIKNANGFDYDRSSFKNSYRMFWDMVNDNLKKKKKWNTNLYKDYVMYNHNGVCFAKQVKLIRKI
jgi:hypothetical protein